MHTSDREGRDCDGRDANSLAADAPLSTSESVGRTENDGGKKFKVQQSGASTLLRMISGVSETSCLGRRVVWARRTKQIKKLMTRSTH